MQHVEETILKTKELLPDRLAFYSYAHVPWVKPGQRAYSEKDLPEIFMQQLKKVIDFDVHIVRPNEEDKYHLMDVHSPFLNYVKEYKSKFI